MCYDPFSKITGLMNSFYLALLILAALSFVRCRESSHQKLFDSMEMGITNNPDSVLTLLQQADTTLFNSAADKARYHLLMAEARYKAGIDDSITDHVLPAVAYYKDHGSRNDAARAYFYSALVKSNRLQYPGAAIDLLRAEKIAKADNDTMRLALIYRALGDTFTYIHNWKNALSYYSKAQKYFEDAKAYNYSYYAYYDMARCYLATHNYPLAIKYALLSYKHGEEANDMSLKCGCMTMLADCYWYLKEYRKAYDIYREIYDWSKDFMTYQDYYRLGMLHLHFGNVDQAREMEKKISVLNPEDKSLYTELMIHDKKYPEAINP